MLAAAVFKGIKQPQISQVCEDSRKRAHSLQIAILSKATERGATEGSSNNRLAVSLIEAAKLLRQHSGELSMFNPSNLAETENVVSQHIHQCGGML